MRKWWPLLVVSVVAALVFLWRLGSWSLGDWDEAIYAQMSKEMLQTGDWITIHWNFRPNFEKPPLMIWATAVLFQCFGVSEFWARAVSAFSGVGLVAVSYLIGTRIYDWRVGLGAAAILLSAEQFVKASRFGTMDVFLSLWVYPAIYCYLVLKDKGERWWYAVWISAAMAIMTKGAGVIAPATIGLSLLLEGRVGAAVRSKHFIGGIVVAAVIALFWHVVVYLRHGQAFLDSYLGYHVFTRFTEPIRGGTRGPVWYAEVLRSLFFPWTYVALFAVLLAIKENFPKRTNSIILLAVIVVVIGLYGAAKTKFRWYVIPACPSLAILTASLVVKAIEDRKALAYGGLLVAAALVIVNAPAKLALLFGLVLLGVCLFGWARRRPLDRALAISIGCYLLFAGMVTTRRAFLERGMAPGARLATAAATHDPADHEPILVYLKNVFPSVLYYSGRPTDELKSREDLNQAMDRYGTKRRIILPRSELGDLQSQFSVEVVTEADDLVYANIADKRRGGS